jgi:hypothetical protein
MSLAELPRDDAGNIQIQTDKEFAIWDAIPCNICGEPQGKHTLFGRQLAGPNIGKAWHNACGYDTKPSGDE